MTNTMQTIWVLMCGGLIFFMQAGFTCFEGGIVQSKNVISVAIENMLTFMITVICFGVIGFPIMFGESINNSSVNYSFVFLELMFATTAITIFAGAMSERTKLKPLLIASAISAAVVYPVFGKWVWGGLFISEQEGWLKALGFMDFAGASVVHMTAGGIALAGVIVVGKRKNSTEFGSNIPLATLGVFILIFGWLGFNGASSYIDIDRAGITLMNTMISGAFGMAGAIIVNLCLRKKGGYLISIFNGVLGGLVAITACSFYCTPIASMALGLIAGSIVDLSRHLLVKLGIDDTVNAVSVHLVGGIVGCLLMPFFIQAEYLETTDRMTQFGVEIIGVLVNFAWAFGTAFIIFKILDKTIGLRVTENEEKKGLNIVEFKDILSWENHMAITGYENEIGEKNELLRKQTRLLTVTEEQEKKRLSRDIHDGMGQSLAALKLILGMTEHLAADSGNEQIRNITSKAVDLVDTSVKEMRNVINNMNPENLEEKGIEVALQTMLDKIDNLDGIKFGIEIKDPIPEFEETVMINIYRVVQEAVTNVVKHSKCNEAKVLCYRGNEKYYIFEINDNGKGFSVVNEEFGIGIPSMGDRVKMIGGMFQIYSCEESGTRVIMEVPYDR